MHHTIRTHTIPSPHHISTPPTPRDETGRIPLEHAILPDTPLPLRTIEGTNPADTRPIPRMQTVIRRHSARQQPHTLRPQRIPPPTPRITRPRETSGNRLERNLPHFRILRHSLLIRPTHLLRKPPPRTSHIPHHRHQATTHHHSHHNKQNRQNNPAPTPPPVRNTPDSHHRLPTSERDSNLSSQRA